jgi:hypothetical protein
MNHQELRREITAIIEQEAESNVLPKVMALLRDRYAEFDGGARQEADRILDGLIQVGVANARERIGTLEDGAEKRSMARSIARGERTHVTAYDLIETLKGETQQKNPVVPESVEPFVTALQVCADFLFDARRGPVSGKRDAVLHGLFMGLLDELLAAFHLSQRAFSSQAYAHLRTIEEILDAIDLLVGDAVLLDKWLNATEPDGERAVFKEIRQRVGTVLATDESRKLYAFLSALGPHSQFRAFRSRTALSEDDAGQRVATIYFVGSPKQLEATNILTVRSAVALAHHVARAFPLALNKEDVEKQLKTCRLRLAELLQAHLLPIADQMDMNPAEVRQLLVHRMSDLTS